jgi:hypothetical protein
MEIAAKVWVYLTLGVVLVALNVCYVRVLYQSLTGRGDLVVAPVRILGGTGDATAAGETLARMIISKLQSLEWDLQNSQAALQKGPKATNLASGMGSTDAPSAPSLGGVTAGVLGTPKTAVLNAQLFEPTNIDVKVAGVEIGRLLPGVQRWFMADRTLVFSVSWQGTTATIAGNVDALSTSKTRPLWISLENATSDSVATAIALSLVQLQWARDSVEFGELNDQEFRVVVDAINEIARINRRVVAYHAVAKAEFQKVLESVDPLADRMSGWAQLTYFVASIAEAAEAYDRALVLYRRVTNAPQLPLSADLIRAKISSLDKQTAGSAGDAKPKALQNLKKAAEAATAILNRLFSLNLSTPKVALLKNDELNAFWDGKKISAPAAVQDMPDITYHETAWQFLQAKWQFKWQDQSGALANSYTDVLASLVKQEIAQQDAKHADWTIAPGAIAWLSGKPNEILTDKRPLRSLKAPGSAYDSPVLGKDPQVDHISDLVSGEADSGGIHVNSGIANKAFYEAAIKIGSAKAGQIWIQSLPKFGEATNLRTGAEVIYKTAVDQYGQKSPEAVAIKAAWNAVGLLE